MRARGAQVTDIVVLVVAADDSVMPQTIEAISHAKAAGVPIVVAINKVDKPDANPDRIKQQLTDYDILVEDWGGKYQSVEISAKFGQNVDVLLDKILVEAELLDLKANPSRAANGAVIEAVMKKGFGPVATIIVQKGTLKVGDSFVAGVSNGKVRTLLDEREKKVEIAGPSDPVIVVGFDTLPEAGDTFIVTSNEIEARNIAQERSKLKREQEFRQIRKISLDDISQRIQQGNVKELKLILKGDVSGSVEALSDSLAKLSQEEVRVLIIHKGVGTILETDVILASASEAVIVGFNVSVDATARKLADVEKVDIRQYNIIYDCLNEIHLALEGLLSPEYQEETTAVIEVRQTFKISRIGTIAGCHVQSGKISRSDKIRVLRDGLLIHSGYLNTLKRERDDVKEVDAGFECGILLNNFNEYQIGDIIESYKINEIKRKLR
jgi:translation initiation factor IF-2